MKTLCLALMCAAVAATPLRAAPVRLALVPAETSARTAVDLLTAELSTNTQLALIERTEVERIQREQQLSASSATDNLKLGQTLGADGLLLLERSGEGTNQALVLRLIAVKPGVILCTTQYPWPLPELGEWPKRVVQQMEPLLPKLGVLVKDAVPISILNLRSAVSSAEAVQVERNLTLLLVNRLAREKEVFVLERQHMAMLGAEKELKGMDESPFWNGGYLLEGVVDREGFSRDTITITVRLVPPNKVSETFEVSGRRDDLPGVAEQLVRQVFKRVKQVAGDQTWNPAAEAARYLDEAQWAMRWGLYSQAQEAADSAWALGNRGRDLAIVRVLSYLYYSEPGWSGAAPCVPCLEGLATAMENYLVATPMLATNRTPLVPPRRTLASFGLGVRSSLATNSTPVIYGGQKWTHVNPLSQFSLEGRPRVLTNEPPGDWEQIGLSILQSAATRLWPFAFAPTRPAEGEGKLSRIREAARQVEHTLLRSEGPPSPRAYETIVGMEIFLLKVGYDWVWAASPQEIVAEYRKLLAGGPSEEQRRRFLFRGADRPMILGWTAEARAQLPRISREFCEELGASTNATTALLGRLLHHHFLPAASMNWDLDGTYNRSAKAIFETVWAHREELLCSEPGLLVDAVQVLDQAPTKDSHVTVRPGTIGDYGQYFRTNFLHFWATQARCFNAELAQRLFQHDDFNTNHLSALLRVVSARTGNASNQVPRFRQAFLRSFVQASSMFEATPREPVGFPTTQVVLDSLFEAEDYEGEELRGLVADFRRFRSAIPVVENSAQSVYPDLPPGVLAILKADDARKRAFREFVTARLNLLEARLSPAVSVAPPPASPASAAPPLAGKPLLVSRWWQCPTNRIHERYTSDIALFHPLYREGRLWFQGLMLSHFVATNEYGTVDWNRSTLGCIVAVDLKDLSSEEYPFEPELKWLGDPPWCYGIPRLSFDVLNRTVYRVHRDKLVTATKEVKTWRELDVPVVGQAQPLALNGRLYLGSDEALLECDPSRGSTRIMASVRRRPAINDLDRLGRLGPPSLLSATSNVLWFAVGDTIWPWNIAQGSWDLPISHRLPSMTVYPEQNQILFVRGNPQHEFAEVGRFAPGRPVEILFHVPAESSMFARAPSSTPIWSGAGGRQPALWPRVPERENLWSLEWSAPEATPTLWFFDDRFEEPFLIPLALKTNPLATVSAPWCLQFRPLAVPEGLIIFPRATSGFWFISREDLDRAVADRLRERPRPPRSRPDLKRVAGALPEILETNQSVWIDERGTNVARILRIYDQDQNGKLHYGELTRAVRTEDALAGFRPGPVEGLTSLLLISPFDLDSDGMLDLSELQGMVKRGKPPLTYTELLKRYDKDGDGMVRGLEGSAARQDLKPSQVETPYPGLTIDDRWGTTINEGVSSRWQPPDRRPSMGGSSPTVRTNRLLPALRRYDLNGDGKLDEQERAAMRKEVSK